MTEGADFEDFQNDVVDILPEVRKARADPIDLNDEDREMIAEARVRIANVKGKKAKRKAR